MSDEAAAAPGHALLLWLGGNLQDAPLLPLEPNTTASRRCATTSR